MRERDNKWGILGTNQNVERLSEDQIGLALRMTGFEQQVCRCGDGSGRLSDLSYDDPPVASGSGLSFRSGGSPSPIPIPPPVSQVQGSEVPLPSSGSNSSDKENSSPGSFQSAQQAVNELVEIVEADPEVDDEEAQALSDAMDAEVRSRLFQCCKSKQHPHRFAPFPKGWEADQARRQRRRTFQRGGAERERFVRTRNLREGLLGDADVESEHSGSSSGYD